MINVEFKDLLIKQMSTPAGRQFVYNFCQDILDEDIISEIDLTGRENVAIVNKVLVLKQKMMDCCQTEYNLMRKEYQEDE